MGKVTLFYNCTLLRDHKLIKNDLWVQNGRIIDAASVEFVCDEAVDCGGSLISPGFIDLKLNGAFGVDFSGIAEGENAQEKVETVATKLPSTGVTTFCPTVLTSSKEYYHRVLGQIRVDGRHSGKLRANILGLHLDGPFISTEKSGAHPSHLTRTFEEFVSADEDPFQAVKEVYGREMENVSLVTLAPELPGAIDVIKQLTRWDIRVSLGHSSCTLNEGLQGVQAGASMLTHLFNAMPAFHHRDPSLVGLMASELPENRQVYFGIIADGVHTHPAAVRMAHRIAPNSLFLVTDGVAPLGLGPGAFSVNGREVTVEGDIGNPTCKVAGTDTLCGSVSPMDACIRRLRQFTQCSTVYALEAATLHPAQAMGITKKKGTLDIGTDADLVFLDPLDLTVRATYIAGQCVFQKESE